ncbi:MAG TPA: hypothetical protein VIY48_22270 [Candidatus Paceibacterota bacterium]
MEPFRERLWKKFMKRVGFEWNGYSAPEQCPDVVSRQVLTLAEMVEELEASVLQQKERILSLESKVATLETLRKISKGVCTMSDNVFWIIVVAVIFLPGFIFAMRQAITGKDPDKS